MTRGSEFEIEHGFQMPDPSTGAETGGDLSSPAGADTELVAIVDFIRGLARSVKAARMYPANNPVYLRSLNDLMEKLGLAFREHSVVRLIIGQNRLYFQGEAVYENVDPEDSLSRTFFRDGIREVSFHIGMDREEMGRFLEMIRQSTPRDATEDLVTQLWSDTLPHITYTAIDDMLDADLSDAEVPPEFGSDFMNYVDFQLDFTDTDDESHSSLSRDEALAAAGEMHRKLLAGSRDILAISDAELLALRPEITDENATALLERVIDTFFDVLDQDADPAARNTLFVVLENALGSLVSQRQLEPAAHILKSAREMMERRPDLLKAHRSQIDSLFLAAFDRSRLEIVLEVLELSGTETAGTAEEYLSHAPREALKSICELLGTAVSRRAHRALCAALAGAGQPAVDELIPFLKDGRNHVVCNVLMALGVMKASHAARHIKSLVTHEDLKIRREALTALSLIGEGDALQALVSLLRDPDPRMRASAAGSLARLGRTAVNPLLQVVLARDFESRSLEEKRGFFDALGRTNSPELFPYLKLLLEKKPMFNRAQAEEMRICAVEALARMTPPEAQALLDLAGRDPSSAVRASAAGALRRRSEPGAEAEDV